MRWIYFLGSLMLLTGATICFYKSFFKRFWDCVLSGMAIVILSPVFIVLTILGAIFMKGNPVFTQERPGKNGKIFKLIKFRTMSSKKDEYGNLLPDEKRLNKYGKFLRATSLDELLELFNIFAGHMSIVGPRPLLIEYLPYYTPEENKRHDVRPGLTGLAQINGRNNLDWNKRLEYDVQYVKNISLLNDIKIILLTLLKVLKRSDVAENTNATEGNLAQIRKNKTEND